MVMLVWFVLSLFGVCDFTWLPVFIDAIIFTFIFVAGENNGYIRNVLGVVSLGIAIFAFVKFFFGLTISGWWILVSPIVAIVVIFLPGGFTIFNLLFSKLNLMVLPTWGLVLGIISDVISLVLLIILIVSIVGDKKSKKNV